MSEMVFFTNNYADRSTREPASTKRFCRNCGTAPAPGAAIGSECGPSTA